MSKPLTKAKAIGVRLGVQVDREVRRRAELDGLSPGLWIGRLVASEIGTAVAEPEPKPIPTVRKPAAKRTQPTEPECAHTARTVIGGGMARCTACQAVRGPNGVWRAT